MNTASANLDSTDNRIQPQSCEPPRELQERLMEQLNGISMFSAVAAEALEMVNDVDCSVPDFCNVIERDVPLAMNALAIANSAIYSPSRPTGSLKEAVVRLGMRECKNLILTTCSSSLMKKLPLRTQWVRDLIWQHSFTTATACGYLNRVLDIGFHGEEYAAGLLHDFGRLLLATVDAESFAEADDLSFVEDAQLLQREQKLFGTDHCQFGAWFALHEGMPNMLIDPIRSHHCPADALGNNTLVALVAAADHMANHLQSSGQPDGYDPTTNEAISLLGELVGPSIESRFVDMYDVILQNTQTDIADLAGISN